MKELIQRLEEKTIECEQAMIVLRAIDFITRAEIDLIHTAEKRKLSSEERQQLILLERIHHLSGSILNDDSLKKFLFVL